MGVGREWRTGCAVREARLLEVRDKRGEAGRRTWARVWACRRTAEVRLAYYTNLSYLGIVDVNLVGVFSGRCAAMD